MRLFVAVKCPAEIRDGIRRMTREMCEQNPELQTSNWVKPENLHLTLKFLGETAEGRVEALGRSLREAAKSHAPFSVKVRGAGAFPRRSRAHVFWAGIEDPEGKLQSLARTVEKSCSPAGLSGGSGGGKPFAPHVTFARFSSPLLGVRAAKILEPHLERPFGDIIVDRFYLIQSVLLPSGAAYNDLREFPLHD